MTVAFDIRTAPFSRWNVENEADEPAHGYFARLVAAEGHASVTRYSLGIDIDINSMNPERLLDVVLKLPLSGDRKLRIRNATPVRRQNGVWLAGQRFNVTNLSFSSRRWCPGCLHESPHHRAWWDIAAIRECPYHRHPLLDLDQDGEPVRWWWPVMDASPRGTMLAAPLPRANDTETFEGYIIGRLGFDRPIKAPLLDQSDPGTLLDLCVMVGRLLSSTSSAEAPPAEWKYAKVGFEALGRDAAHFVEAVRAWIRIAVPQEDRVKGYGFVFDWIIQRWWELLDKRLTDMLQKVFRKALALEGRGNAEPLTSHAFLDEEVSLAALAHRMHVSKFGVAVVADMLGFFPDRDRYRGLVMFDAAEAAAIETYWPQTAGGAEAGKMLGLSFQEIKQVAEAGYLRKFESVASDEEGGCRYLKSEIDHVLCRIRALCKQQQTVTCVPFRRYAKHHDLRAGELAVAILDCRHEVVLGSSSKAGFDALMIVCEPAQSSRRPLRVLKRLGDLLSLAEAQVELNVTRATMQRLIEDGHLKPGPGDGAARWLDKASVRGFATAYRNAREYVPAFADHLEEMIALMAANGVNPLLERRPKDRTPAVSVIYRYTDIAAALGFERDPARLDEPAFLALWEKVRALAGNMPPYLQLPYRLPACGQVVSNAKNNVAFLVSYDAGKRVLSFEGRRNASRLGVVNLFVDDQEGSVARFEEALVSLIAETPRRK